MNKTQIIMTAEQVAALDLDTSMMLVRKRARTVYEKASFTKTGAIRLARLGTSGGWIRQINRYGVSPSQRLFVDLNQETIDIIMDSPYAYLLQDEPA